MDTEPLWSRAVVNYISTCAVVLLKLLSPLGDQLTTIVYTHRTQGYMYIYINMYTLTKSSNEEFKYILG